VDLGKCRRVPYTQESQQRSIVIGRISSHYHKYSQSSCRDPYVRIEIFSKTQERYRDSAVSLDLYKTVPLAGRSFRGHALTRHGCTNYLMTMLFNTEDLDLTDLAILRLLQRDATLTHKEIAYALHRCVAMVHERTRRLKERGYIRRV